MWSTLRRPLRRLSGCRWRCDAQQPLNCNIVSYILFRSYLCVCAISNDVQQRPHNSSSSMRSVINICCVVCVMLRAAAAACWLGRAMMFVGRRYGCAGARSCILWMVCGRAHAFYKRTHAHAYAKNFFAFVPRVRAFTRFGDNDEASSSTTARRLSAQAQVRRHLVLYYRNRKLAAVLCEIKSLICVRRCACGLRVS